MAMTRTSSWLDLSVLEQIGVGIRARSKYTRFVKPTRSFTCFYEMLSKAFVKAIRIIVI